MRLHRQRVGRCVAKLLGGVDLQRLRGAAALVGAELVADLLALAQSVEAGSADVGAVEEQVLPVRLGRGGGDETEAAVADELLDGAGGHGDASYSQGPRPTIGRCRSR